MSEVTSLPFNLGPSMTQEVYYCEGWGSVSGVVYVVFLIRILALG
jgi:hypothetical protein